MTASAPTLAGRSMQPQKTHLTVKLPCLEQEFGLDTFQPTRFMWLWELKSPAQSLLVQKVLRTFNFSYRNYYLGFWFLGFVGGFCLLFVVVVVVAILLWFVFLPFFLSRSSENSIFYKKDRTCLSPLATFVTGTGKGQQLREKINEVIPCYLDPHAIHSEQLK